MLALIVILVAIVLAIVAAVALWTYGSDGFRGTHFIAQLFGLLLLTGAGLASLAVACTTWDWFAAESKAQIINREYGTDYTREEVFFASDVIDTIREIDRKRIEINGDIMRQSEESEQ